MRRGIGRRRSSNLVLLWLWYRPAAAAPIQPLAWEFPNATGMVLKRPKKKKKFTLSLYLLRRLKEANTIKKGNISYSHDTLTVFLATSTACISSGARDRTHTTAVTTVDP